MSSDGEILPGAAITSVSIGNQIRIYFQDVHGYIREARSNGTTWSGGTYKDILFPAKPGSPLAAAVYNSKNRASIAVYSIDRSDNLQGHCKWFDCTSKDWHLGGLGASPKASHTPNTRLAALSCGNQIHVYYQTSYGTIQEHCFDPVKGWYQGSTLPVALSGSSLAVTANELFYQDTAGWLRDNVRSGQQWKNGSVMIEAPMNTPIAAVSWPNSTMDRVYYRSLSEEIVEVKWGAYPVRMTRCIGSSNIAATVTEESVVVFHQRNLQQLQQVRNLGESGEWLLGHVVPTGSLV